jgi:hypothetical protein
MLLWNVIICLQSYAVSQPTDYHLTTLNFLYAIKCIRPDKDLVSHCLAVWDVAVLYNDQTLTKMTNKELFWYQPLSYFMVMHLK